MKQPNWMLIALLTTKFAWASDIQDKQFTPCDKTYITPEKVSLKKNTIQVESDGCFYQTSAIYSDYQGLYYKDFLQSLKEEISLQEGIAFEEEQAPIIEETAVVYSDESSALFDDAPPITSHEEPVPLITKSSLSVDKPATKPTRPSKVHGWPYCEKSR